MSVSLEVKLKMEVENLETAGVDVANVVANKQRHHRKYQCYHHQSPLHFPTLVLLESWRYIIHLVLLFAHVALLHFPRDRLGYHILAHCHTLNEVKV